MSSNLSGVGPEQHESWHHRLAWPALGVRASENERRECVRQHAARARRGKKAGRPWRPWRKQKFNPATRDLRDRGLREPRTLIRSETAQGKGGVSRGGRAGRVKNESVSYLAARFSSDEETCSSAEAASSSCAEYSMAAPKRVSGAESIARHARTLFRCCCSLTEKHATRTNKCRHWASSLLCCSLHKTIAAAARPTRKYIPSSLFLLSPFSLSLFFSLARSLAAACCLPVLLCALGSTRFAAILAERGNVRSLQHTQKAAKAKGFLLCELRIAHFVSSCELRLPRRVGGRRRRPCALHPLGVAPFFLLPNHPTERYNLLAWNIKGWNKGHAPISFRHAFIIANLKSKTQIKQVIFSSLKNPVKFVSCCKLLVSTCVLSFTQRCTQPIFALLYNTRPFQWPGVSAAGSPKCGDSPQKAQTRGKARAN